MNVHNDFHIDVERVGDVAVLALRGEFDLARAREVEQALDTALAHEPRLVIVDLGEVSFIDSTGLRTLLAANESARASGREFALVQGPHQVRRLLELTRASEHLRIVENRAELLAPSE